MAVDDHAIPAPADEATTTTEEVAAAADGATTDAATVTGRDMSIPHTETIVGDNDNNDGGKAEGHANAAASSTAADAPADGPDDEPPPAKRRSLCDICHSSPAKYKCPRCPQAYCSVVCSRTHRDDHPPDPAPDRAPLPSPASAPSSAATATATTTATTATAANRHPFRVLDDAPELQRLFVQYPGLPARLRAIHEATLPPPPPPPLATDGGRGGSWRGRGRGGGRGGPYHHHYNNNNNNKRSSSSQQQPWTREQGLRQGQRALRQARVDPGDDGDGVRAYCELVLHLLARDTAAATAAASTAPTASAPVPNGSGSTTTTAAGLDEATALVRQEVARADAALVEQLLQAETAAGGRR